MNEMPPIAILAGGLATRMRPLTDTCPKALVPVAGEPFAFHQLRLLASNGFRSIVFLIGHLGEQIIDAVGDGATFGLSVRYVSDGPHLLGTAGSIARALPELGPEFCTIYGDSWLEFDYSAAVAAFRQKPALALMSVVASAIASEPANACYADGMILRYSKTQRGPEMQHVDHGFGIYKASVFEEVSVEQPSDLAGLQEALAQNRQLLGFEVPDCYYEVGSFSGRQELEDLFAARSRTAKP